MDMNLHEISWIIGAFSHHISWTFMKIHELFQLVIHWLTNQNKPDNGQWHRVSHHVLTICKIDKHWLISLKTDVHAAKLLVHWKVSHVQSAGDEKIWSDQPSYKTIWLDHNIAIPPPGFFPNIFSTTKRDNELKTNSVSCTTSLVTSRSSWERSVHKGQLHGEPPPL